MALPGGTADYVFQGFPIAIAGKTGTAENPHGDDHGWFVAYAPYDKPTIVVAVVVEQGGFGADAAAPIARKIMEAAFGVPPQKDAADELAEEEAAKSGRPAPPQAPALAPIQVPPLVTAPAPVTD